MPEFNKNIVIVLFIHTFPFIQGTINVSEKCDYKKKTQAVICKYN